MAYLSGKQAFLQILKTEGVSVMFGNPGTTELPLMDGLAREPGIRYVLALQEAVAISMADAYAQAHGGLAAVNVHVSPGLGNAMGMLYDAYKAHSPLLLTAGQHDQSFTVTEPILWSDLPPVATPFVKWATEARRLEDVPRIVRRAVKTALAQPSGPVFLSLPVDVVNAERDNLDLLAPTRVAPRLVGDRAAIDAAAKRLVAADKPLIVAGDAVAHSDALAELVELAELIGAPVMLEGVSSTCSFPFTHPLYAGSMPRLGPGIKGLLMRHDLLFSVGGDLFTLSLPDDVVVVDEAISSSAGIRNFFRCADAKSFFSLRGGGIGWGLPAALGVKLALPKRPVVALVGDGSAMYTAQALWTAAHESLAVVYVIFNNASYRILKERTKALKGFSAEDDRYVAMDLVDPLIDYVGLAKSLGVVGEHVEKAADVGPAVGRALASGAPALIDVRIDPSFT